MSYSKDEIELLDAVESGNIKRASFDNLRLKEMASETLDLLKQKKQISINMKQSDLNFIKQRANDIGISYQNIIQALVHNYATGELTLKI